MRIKKLNYINKTFGWELDNIEFDKLTLLVGASGVGKTQILNAILDLNMFANGYSKNGVIWEVEFETITGNTYLWKGEFEKKNILYLENLDNRKNDIARIISEELFLNSDKILERTKTETIFKKIPTLKLSQQESIISILKEEDIIKDVYIELKKLVLSDSNRNQSGPIVSNMFYINKLKDEYKYLKKIQDIDESIQIKLYLIFHNDEKTFNSIKERFCEIFPKVEDIKIAHLETGNENIPVNLKELPYIQIKEKGVDKWIPQDNISSGMFKALINICELYLCADGTVFLIDEFENSLGVNCIDEITNEVINSGRNLQFIITSHHPYIINNIPYTNWKLVTRNAGKVKAQKVDKFNIGKSHHDAFMQLLQLEEFLTGSE